VPKDKEKQKEIRFDESSKKNPSKELNTPFRFDILAQLANIPANLTLHELLRLSKEMREALRDALVRIISNASTHPYERRWSFMSPMSSGTTAGTMYHLHP